MKSSLLQDSGIGRDKGGLDGAIHHYTINKTIYQVMTLRPLLISSIEETFLWWTLLRPIVEGSNRSSEQCQVKSQC